MKVDWTLLPTGMLAARQQGVRSREIPEMFYFQVANGTFSATGAVQEIAQGSEVLWIEK